MAMATMARMGFGYFDTILMPARVMGILLEQCRSRQKRIRSIGEKHKPMAVFDIGGID